ncbi:MAG: ABC transporter permease, partial [Paratractidigestivibacter faecalis]
MKPAKPTSAPRSAFGIGVLRTVRGSLKRFVALATICALGVTMICGLKVACIDLRASADRFFDPQDLFDLRVQSTLGLTEDDVSALAAIDGVEAAEGGWVETCYTTVGSSSEKVDVKALSPSGMNQPHVLDGHLPVTSDQVAVTRRFLDESGLSLGDEVTFRGASDGEKDADAGEEDATADASSTAVFSRQTYTICGVVLDPTDINAGNGTMSFRASGGSQYAFFVLPSAVTTDVYTAVYLRVDGAESPLCYSAAYEEAVDDVKARVEAIKSEREEARRQGILDDASSQIDSAEKDALAQLGDAAAQLDDAQAQLDSGAAELADGRAQLDAKSADAASQLDAAQAQLDAGRAELVANQRQVTDGLNQIAAGLGCDVDGIGDALAARRSQLSEARGQIKASAQMLSSLMGDEWPAEAWSRLEGAQTPEEARAAAADVNAVLTPFASEAQAAIDDLVSVVESDEFQQLRDTYENLPQWLRDRVDAAVAQAPATVQKLLRAVLEMPTDQMASQLRDLRSQVGQLSGLADGMVQIVE